MRKQDHQPREPTPMLFDVKRGVHVRVTVATGGAARRGGTRPARTPQTGPGRAAFRASPVAERLARRPFIPPPGPITRQSTHERTAARNSTGRDEQARRNPVWAHTTRSGQRSPEE